MNIETGISQIGSISFSPDPAIQTKTLTASKGSFDEFLQAATDMWNETNTYELAAQKAQLDYVAGKDDNVLGVLLAQERAYSSLNFTVQVTNKIVEAYREIMRMQI